MNPPYPSEITAFEPPLPLGISNGLPWGGYGYFLEPHNKTISKLYKTSTYQSIEGNIELLELPQVNNRPWNVLQLITTQTEPLQICEVKQLDRNAVYAWLSLQRKKQFG